MTSAPLITGWTDQVEKALRESEERWQRLVEFCPVGIVILAGDRVEYINQTGADIVGAPSPESLHGTPFSSFVAGEYRGLYWSRLQSGSIAESRTPTLYRLQPQNGTERYVELIAVPVTYQGHQTRQVVLHDVTERQAHLNGLVEARKRTDELNRLKSAFLANMSHEIRTPLTAIIGFSDLLANQLVGEHRDFVNTIRESAERLMDTLASLFDLSLLESGEMKLPPERLELVEATRQILKDFEPSCAARSIQLVLHLPDEPVVALLNKRAIMDILRHLISNAIKFTHEGAIAIVLKGDETHVAFEVADTGIGISRDFLPSVFDAFRQESIGLSRSYEGNGLGLAVARQLVEQLGGVIQAASEKNLGSTFTVTLPRNYEFPYLSPGRLPVL